MATKDTENTATVSRGPAYMVAVRPLGSRLTYYATAPDEKDGLPTPFFWSADVALHLAAACDVIGSVKVEKWEYDGARWEHVGTLDGGGGL